MAEAIGALAVTIGGDASGLIRELDKSNRKLKEHGDAYASASKAAKAVIADVVAVAGAIAVMTERATANADKTYKMAQAAGMATESFSEMVYVARLSDLSAEQLGTSLNKLNRNMVDAAAGTGESGKAFEALGIKLRNSDGSLKATDQVIADVADRFAKFADGPEKSALAIQIFGKAGAAMIPMLNQGSAGMRQLREEARQLGVVIDEKTGKAAENFRDNLTRLGQVGTGFGNQLMKELLPTLNAVTNAVVDWAKGSSDLQGGVKGASKVIGDNALPVFKLFAQVGGELAAGFKRLGLTIGATGAAVAAVANKDFAGLVFIIDDWLADMKKAEGELAGFKKRIEGLNITPPEVSSPSGGKGKPSAPVMGDDKKKEALKQLYEYIDAVQEAEIAEGQAIAAGDDAITAEKKRVYDERMKAFLDFIDAEQEAAIHEGATLLAIESESARARRIFITSSFKDQAKTVFGELAMLTSGVARSNRTLFEINKVASISMAIINAYEGISKTMAKYPYPLNVAMAAAHAAVAFAQVSAIRNTNFGDTGFAPSVAGTAPATPVTPVPQVSGQTTVIQLNGDTFNRSTIRNLFDQLNEQSRDGGRFVLA